MTKKIDQGIASNLWVNGRNTPTTLIWVSETHAELVLNCDLPLADGQLVALVVRGFLSLPMRVEMQTGPHFVLRFVQRPHASVVDLLRNDLIETGIAAAREAAEEHAVLVGPFLDLAAWDEEDIGPLSRPELQAA